MSSEADPYFNALSYEREQWLIKNPNAPGAQEFGTKHAFDNLQDFSQESLRVVDESGKLVRYRWRESQVRLNALIDKIRAQGRPPRIVILKDRRSGFSTGVAGRFFPETVFRPGQNTLVVAHEYASVQDALYPMYHRFQEHYRPYKGALKLPEIESDTQHGLTWKNGSAIRIATANNLEGARSFGYRRVHFSESAFFSDFKTLLVSVMQTVPNDPDTCVIVESTANGVGGRFYDLCREAQDHQQGSEWQFLFFGWQDDPTCTMPLPCPPQEFQETLGKDTLFNTYVGEELALLREYRLSLEQLYWRRWTIINKCERDINIFNQEYPHSPEVAFRLSGSPALDHAALARYRAHDGLIGRLSVEQVGATRQIMFQADPRGNLTVYRRPVPGRAYVAGVDSASGIDSSDGKGTPDRDWSVCQVLDQDTGEQVAILRCRDYEFIFGQLTAWLCKWYNVAYIVPEVMSNTYGRATLDAILREDYPMDRIYHRRSPLDSATRPHMPRYDDLGWRTDTTTRGQLVSALNMALIEHSIEIYDATTIHELQTFIRSKSGKAEAAENEKDDCVLSLGLAVIGLINAPRLDIPTDSDITSGPIRPYTTSMRSRLIAQMPGHAPTVESPDERRFKRRLLGIE